MQYAPTRVHEKFGGFHISPPVPAKNASSFTLPDKDKPKSCPVLGANPCRGTFWGRMQYAPTRVRAKPARFHISAHRCAKNAPDFTLPNKDTPKPYPVLHPNRRRGSFWGVCFCALHGYVQNLAGFIFPKHVPAKNAPDFTIPNKDTPKTRPVLGLNLRRRTFRGVCFCALHGYVQNLAGFTFPYPDTPKTYPISPFPIRTAPKRTRFHPSQ